MPKVCLISEYTDMKVYKGIIGSLAEIEYKPCSKEDEILENCQGAMVVATLFAPLSRRVLNGLKNSLRYIAVQSTGFNCVDIEAAKELGIPVTNNPFFCTNEVADHTAALMLALIRQIPGHNKNVQEKKEWNQSAYSNIKKISSLTVGFVGFGNIGKSVAARLMGFGARVITFDPFINKNIAKEMKVGIIDSLDELCQQSDVISANLPLNTSTANLFNKKLFEKMVKKPIFVNTSRGGIVNEADLALALDKGWISGAALDVLAEEPPKLNGHPLLGRDNVIITPHIAYYSTESTLSAQKSNAAFIKAFLNKEYDGLPVVNGVNMTSFL